MSRYDSWAMHGYIHILNTDFLTSKSDIQCYDITFTIFIIFSFLLLCLSFISNVIIIICDNIFFSIQFFVLYLTWSNLSIRKKNCQEISTKWIMVTIFKPFFPTFIFNLDQISPRSVYSAASLCVYLLSHFRTNFLLLSF